MAAVLGVLALVLAGAGVVAAVVHEDDDAPQVTELAGGDQATTTSTAEVPASTTTPTTADTATTTTSPATSTSVPRTTTTRPRSTSTTVRRSTTTTTRATPPSTADPAPLCQPDQIDISTMPSSNSYPAGQPVAATSTIRNRSASPCFYRGYNVEFVFRTPAGGTILGSVVHADDVAPRPFAPGQAISHSAAWNPAACGMPTCPTPAPGIYSVEGTWSFSGGKYSALRQFVLT